MKLKFKKQAYQTKAVQAVVDCFKGQPKQSLAKYAIDPGKELEAKNKTPVHPDLFDEEAVVDEYTGFKNANHLPLDQLLENIQAVQQQQNLPVSAVLAGDAICGCNLDIEMETGTGKTYVYIKTMFELYEQYGWSKFIVVVPSIAIREGVSKSFEITAKHFLEQYGRQVRSFIYNSKQLHNIESFSSDAGINVMIINVQAFNARGKDARRIYEALDNFQSRRPIDVIKENRPILILDEPQKMEGKKTLDSFKEFSPLMILRYSATHKTNHNKIHRLDALDAYNQKLVKKIAVRGISVKGLTGTNAYLYLSQIHISTNKAPEASIEFETQLKSGAIKRVTRKCSKGDNLFKKSADLEQYKEGYVISEIDARTDTVSFTNGVELQAGEVLGDDNKATLRHIQIREAIKAHFEKEQILFNQGVKVLTLFFIDKVAKYRQYDEAGEQQLGEYAEIFEKEYTHQLNEILTLEETPYSQYLKRDKTNQVHNGYFSIDKKSKRLIDPKMNVTERKKDEANDVDAYDLILKDKERLLSLDEPVRFIFSHSALREGWDNPNVFVICTLKHSDNTISRRQEVGRGLRIAVNKYGERMDNPATVHQINVLTVVANESYQDFVTALQKDISESLSARPRVADTAYFEGKVIKVEDEVGIVVDKVIDSSLAKQIYKYLLKNDYINDEDDKISQDYHDAKKEGELAQLPEGLELYKDQVFGLIDSVFSDAQLPEIDNDRHKKINPLNGNVDKKEFQALWKRINGKAVYTVDFDSDELIEKCIGTLNIELKVARLKYTVVAGEQKQTATYDALKVGESFKIKESQASYHTAPIRSVVKYDLIGKIAEGVNLTRRTVAKVLSGIAVKVFEEYKINPEDFISIAIRLMNEQKATMVVEKLSYDPLGSCYEIDIFTVNNPPADFSKAIKVERHVYDYVFTDSKIETDFVKELDTSSDVVVYAKLPSGFSIPTPVGNYNPDWAIAFKDGNVKHIYFVAETKGTMSSMQLRKMEEVKVDCARKFFAKISADQVKYDVVDSYDKLMNLVSC
jgi:type III restriction enzyme